MHIIVSGDKHSKMKRDMYKLNPRKCRLQLFEKPKVKLSPLGTNHGCFSWAGDSIRQVKAATITKFKRSAGSRSQTCLESNYTCTVQHFFLMHSSNCYLPRACFNVYPIHYYIAAWSLPLASVKCTLAATCIFMRRPFRSIYVILKKGLEDMNKFIKESDNISR